MKLAHLFKILISKPKAPFCTSTFTPKFLIAFQSIHTREKQYLFLLYNMYPNASNNTPFYTCVCVYMVRKVQPPSPLTWMPTILSQFEELVAYEHAYDCAPLLTIL